MLLTTYKTHTFYDLWRVHHPRDKQYIFWFQQTHTHIDYFRVNLTILRNKVKSIILLVTHGPFSFPEDYAMNLQKEECVVGE